MTGTGRFSCYLLSFSLSLSSSALFDTVFQEKHPPPPPRPVTPDRLGGPEIELQVTAGADRDGF
jgi:hypothetical protein